MHVGIIHMDIIKNILYFSIIIIGFLINFICVIIINKKYNIFKLENLIISYILFIIVFFLFAKIGFIIINKSIIVNNELFPVYFNFFVFGYAFIGGYIGILIYPFMISKLFKCNKLDIMKIYIPNMLILYSILKIGCYINGCCGGFIPIQLIESICYLFAYIYICNLVKSNKYTIKISIILFGLLRLVLSFFRIYNGYYSLIIVEMICLCIVYYGLKIKMIS